MPGDVRRQFLDLPRALREILEKGRPEWEELVRRARWGELPVYMVGCGASFAVGLAGAYAFESLLGWPVVVRTQTGMAVGFKAAGGIRTAKQAMDWLALMKEELGNSWLDARLFRFGASGMLADIERQLEHWATGHYSADYRHPIA